MRYAKMVPREMVGVGGFEPPTSPIAIGALKLTGVSFSMVGGGFKPPTSAIAIGALKLTATGFSMVGVGGFEPPTSRSRTVRSSLTELHPDG